VLALLCAGGCSIASRDDGLPFVLSDADAAGMVTPLDSWALLLGEGDDLQRALFVLVDDRGAAHRVLKFCRAAPCREALDRDGAGLALVAEAGAAAARAPAALGRFEGHGIDVSVETGAAGQPLTSLLMSRAREEDKLRSIDAVARWVLDLALATASPTTTLEPERRRLADELLPAWAPSGVDADLVLGLAATPGVLAHHDLGSWNILSAGPDAFTVVDWESARRPAMPLWDLTYFLVDALAVMSGPAPVALKLERSVAVLTGTAAGSSVLFRWLDDYTTALGIPSSSVGALVTLCWLHHGLSPGRRARAAGGEGVVRPPGHLAQLAVPWLTDPELGPRWPAWQRWRAVQASQ
jgi:hypothetical protein